MPAKVIACISDGNDFGVGRWVTRLDDTIPSLADYLLPLRYHSAKRPVPSVSGLGPGKLYCSSEEFLSHRVVRITS